MPNNYVFIEHTDYIDYQMLIDAEPRFDLILCSLTETDYSMYYEKLKRNYYTDYIGERNLEILFSNNLLLNNRSHITLKELEQVTLYSHQRKLERSSYLLKTIEEIGFNSSNVIYLGREQQSLNNVALGKGVWLSLFPHLPVLFASETKAQSKTIFPLIKMHCFALINKKSCEETVQFYRFYKTFLQ